MTEQTVWKPEATWSEGYDAGLRVGQASKYAPLEERLLVSMIQGRDPSAIEMKGMAAVVVWLASDLYKRMGEEA
jgi:hypothetical protein